MNIPQHKVRNCAWATFASCFDGTFTTFCMRGSSSLSAGCSWSVDSMSTISLLPVVDWKQDVTQRKDRTRSLVQVRGLLEFSAICLAGEVCLVHQWCQQNAVANIDQYYSRTPLNPYPSVESKMNGLSGVMGLEGYAKNGLKKLQKIHKKYGKNLEICI